MKCICDVKNTLIDWAYVILVMYKKSKLPKKQLDLCCLNCGHPFFSDENYCPECGQENKGQHLSFNNFIYEVFSGFLSWDSKFWKTFIPLILKPGKVTLDYAKGKRATYTNPFRFYLIISIVFFLIVNILFNLERLTTITPEANKNNITTNFSALDRMSIQGEVTDRSVSKDTIKQSKPKLYLSFLPSADKLLKYNDEHPDVKVDEALKALEQEDNFWNRFLYNRIHVLNHLDFKNNSSNLIQKGVSFIPISLFFILPFFALFIAILYIRHDHYYVNHLVFVFHMQTVFFIFLILLLPLKLVLIDSSLPVIRPFTLVFLVYLFLALKKVYQQGYIKTFIKFIFLNLVFSLLCVLGLLIVIAATLAMY